MKKTHTNTNKPSLSAFLSSFLYTSPKQCGSKAPKINIQALGSLLLHVEMSLTFHLAGETIPFKHTFKPS